MNTNKIVSSPLLDMGLFKEHLRSMLAGGSVTLGLVIYIPLGALE